MALLELYQGAVFSIGERPWIGVGLELSIGGEAVSGEARSDICT